MFNNRLYNFINPTLIHLYIIYRDLTQIWNNLLQFLPSEHGLLVQKYRGVKNINIAIRKLPVWG